MNQEKVWDAIALPWKDFRVVPYTPAIDFLKRNTKENFNILDFGCGSGRNFIKLKNSRIYGLDFSQKMIDFSLEKVKSQKINAELKKISNEQILYPDEFFDIGICVNVLHCVDSASKREKVLREIYRTLKLGAKLFISVWSKNHERIKNKEKECFVPWTADGKKYERYTYIFDQKEIKALLEKVGFEIENIVEDENINVICRKG